jgi:HD-like signal output (HDOD) protein
VKILVFILVASIAGWILWVLLRKPTRRTEEHATLQAAAQLPAAAGSDTERSLSSAEVFARLHALAFGATTIVPQLPTERRGVTAAVDEILANVTAEPRYAPRRPLLLPELLRAVNDEAVSRRELALIVAKDPSLVGNLLELANTPLYRVSAQPVESIDRAVAVLGTEGLRSLITTSLVQPVFRITSGSFARFPEITWEHTYRAAAAAETHAALIENSDPFAAQLLALVMGLATIVVFRVACDQFDARSGLPPDAGLIAGLIDVRSAAVARRIAASWELSGRVLAALEDQAPQTSMLEPTALGRSLHFGRLAGALAVLRSKGLIDDATAQRVLAASGATGPRYERIWARLVG